VKIVYLSKTREKKWPPFCFNGPPWSTRNLGRTKMGDGAKVGWEGRGVEHVM